VGQVGSPSKTPQIARRLVTIHNELHSAKSNRQIDEMSGAHLGNDAVIEVLLTVDETSTNWGHQFFERLAELFDERRKKDHGSIFLTQKCSMINVTK
jgi:hypothetical protein